MGNLAVIGMHCGDESKGMTVYRLGKNYDVGARGQGGANAGHQNRINGADRTLHLLSALAFYPGKDVVIGNGCVILPSALTKDFQTAGEYADLTGRVYVSDRAHVTLQHHTDADSSGSGVGSTKKGISPTYRSKVGRTGIRVIDLVDAANDNAYRVELVQRMMKEFTEARDRNRLMFDLSRYINNAAETLFSLPIQVADVSQKLNGWMRDGRSIILEGAQATLLDVDHGTYPFVTSSNCSVGGFVTGLGIDPRSINKIIGVAKATNSRVGDGPFPVEDEEVGRRYRETWGEFGATSGRPRRLGGGFDAVQGRYSVRVNGMDGVVLACLDRLSGTGDLYICTAYEAGGRELRDWPASLKEQRMARPKYTRLPGFDGDISKARKFNDLPKAARGYVDALEQELGRPIVMISVGKEPDQYILRNQSLLPKPV